MKAKNSTKVLFVFIGILLVGFFGCGIYFIVKHVYGAGFMGLGFGLMGFGIAILLAEGVLFGTAESSSVKVSAKSVSVKSMVSYGDVILTVNRLKLCWQKDGQTVDGSVAVTEQGLTFSGFPASAGILFSDVTAYAAMDKTGFSLTGTFSKGKERTEDTIVVSDAPPIQMMAFFNYVKAHTNFESLGVKKDDEE